MLKRTKYLNLIKGFYHEPSLIKIIYGLRRSGKSIILKQIMDDISKTKVKKSEIIYISFETLEYSFIKTAEDLYYYIKNLTNDNKFYYIFLDEIGQIKDFEKALNSLRILNRYSIFITGSNSRLTFKELSTELSGRYVSFRVNPLTFKEATLLTNCPKENYEKLLFNIFEWGTLPQRFLYTDEQNINTYISDVYDSIILKDIVEALNIKDIPSFRKILQYVLETEGKEFSATNIINYLKNEHQEISTQTLYTYLDALCNAFIINKVYRYDVVGKATLKTLNKYYTSDLGIRRIKTTNKETNYSLCLENIVYNDLIAKGYTVYIGKTNKGKIDFVAIKNKNIKYIQVALYLSNEETIEREFNAFNNIPDKNDCYVISLDKDNKSKNGIKHLYAIDFLMNDNF